MLTVPFVTTWDKACGVAEHGFYLREAVQASDPSIHLAPVTDLHPDYFLKHWKDPLPPLVLLNYHAALLSQWSPDSIREYRRRGGKVISIFHDSGVPSTDQCKAVVDASDVTILHEATTDLPKEKIRYWRMGVPGPCINPYWFDAAGTYVGGDGRPDLMFKAYRNQPVVGSLGFSFGWKGFNELAHAASECGWALLLIAPNATPEEVQKWKTICPDSLIITSFTPREMASALLSGCDATAFPYVTNNAGQSGAILHGIAARKPVIAYRTCRQFRSLFEDADKQPPQVQFHPNITRAIRWCETWENMVSSLKTMPLGRADAGIIALAEEESWKWVGQRYASLLRELAT